MPIKICVCNPAGEPTLPSTWSGTPANICRVLEETGHLHSTVNSSVFLTKPLRKIARAASTVYYGGTYHIDRGMILRHFRARALEHRIRQSGAADVLHTGSMDLPLVASGHPARHYLYTDTTWNLWRRGDVTINRYSAKLLRDSEELERKSLQQMTHIFSTSEYVRDNIIAHYQVPPERVTTVGTGRGAIKPLAGEKDYANGFILFVAKDRFADKGGPLLVAGFARALQRNPALRLKIVGDPSYREFVRDVPNVDILGFVPLDQLQTLFNEAALFAMPATNEPWGLVYLEALSCKTPILALKTNAVPEITNHGEFGFMLPNDDPEKLAETLIEAFADPARLARMGSGGQAACLERYSWQRTVGQIVEGVERCAAK